MVAVGHVVGEGRTSTVYAYGRGSVVKVPKPHIPDRWIEIEADFAGAVASVGAPAPAIEGLAHIDGRPSVVYEHVDGELLWDLMLREPSRREALVAEFILLQRQIHALAIPEHLPDSVARMRSKLEEIAGLARGDVDEASALIGRLPRGAAVLHGDLHPGNVLVSASGLVALDWFDVSIGHPITDVLRTTLLLRPLSSGFAPLHLVDATPRILEELTDLYVSAFGDVLEDESPQWRAIVAICRLSEAAEVDSADLWAHWRARSGERSDETP